MWYNFSMASGSRKIIVGNWKMNPSSAMAAVKIFDEIKIIAAKLRRTQTVICPPLLYLESLRKKIRGNKIFLGAQNVFWGKGTGPFTGEVSAEQILSSGGTYVIVGHSERRALGETDELINKKTSTALKAGLRVILCVGEKSRDKDGAHLDIVASQLLGGLDKIQRRYFLNIVLAYEPVWAIGAEAKGADSPSDAYRMAIFLRKVFAEVAGNDLALSTPIIYGGSVNAENAGEFLKQGFDGLLIGRESLNPKHFNEILKQASDV